MTIKSSGPLSFSDITNEFGKPAGGVPFSRYYRGGAYTTGNNTKIAASGKILLSSFYGATKSFDISLLVIGAGGGGSGGGGDGGVGGHAGSYVSKTITIDASLLLDIWVGNGGAGGTGAGAGSNSMNPIAYGQAGQSSTITIAGVTQANAAGGAIQTADAPGGGGSIPAAENSYYTTLFGAVTAGSANPGGNGGAGNYGGGGGGGGSPHTGYGGYGNGGAGGGGFVMIEYSSSLPKASNAQGQYSLVNGKHRYIFTTPGYHSFSL